MKKIITFIVAILVIFITSNLFAQGEQKRINIKNNEDFFNNSKYIVEGKMHTSRCYDAKGLRNMNDIYTEIIFIVKYVYRDEDKKIKCNDTITIVQNIGNMLWEDRIDDIYTHYHEERRDNDVADGFENTLVWGNKYNILFGGGNRKCTFIFFLNESNYPDNPNRNNNYFRTRFLENSIPSGFIFQRPINGLIGLNFNNRNELYKYMEKFERVTVPEPEQPKKILTPAEKQKKMDEFNRSLEIKYKIAKERKEQEKKRKEL